MIKIDQRIRPIRVDDAWRDPFGEFMRTVSLKCALCALAMDVIRVAMDKHPNIAHKPYLLIQAMSAWLCGSVNAKEINMRAVFFHAEKYSTPIDFLLVKLVVESTCDAVCSVDSRPGLPMVMHNARTLLREVTERPNGMTDKEHWDKCVSQVDDWYSSHLAKYSRERIDLAFDESELEWLRSLVRRSSLHAHPNKRDVVDSVRAKLGLTTPTTNGEPK